MGIFSSLWFKKFVEGKRAPEWIFLKQKVFIFLWWKVFHEWVRWCGRVRKGVVLDCLFICVGGGVGKENKLGILFIFLFEREKKIRVWRSCQSNGSPARMSWGALVVAPLNLTKKRIDDARKPTSASMHRFRRISRSTGPHIAFFYSVRYQRTREFIKKNLRLE